jgi:aminopeptidase N
VTIPGIGGGAESTSATVIGESVIHDGRAEQDFSTAWLVAHEAAHQWWGDLVTMRSWNDTWINESFATYADYRYAAFSLGADEGAVNLQEKKDAYFQEARTRYQRPIVFDRYAFPNDNFDRHTYQKGAAVLHLLRFVMGDAAFQRATSAFLHAYAFRAADTHDFQDVIKTATGQNLDWFFEQWVYQPGHPVLEVSHNWDENAGKLRLRVVQKQDTSTGTPIYRAPIVVEWTTPAGKESKQVWIEKREQVSEFDARQRPRMVRFDRGDHLLAEITFRKSVEELAYQLQHDDAAGRIRAAAELGNLADARVVEALRSAAAGDSFWAVRRSAVQALGTMRRPADVSFLRERALDPNSRVRTAALAALAPHQDPALAGFLRSRFEQDSSYLAQAEALRALAQCGSPDVRSFLADAARLPSPRDVIRHAAEWGLQVLDSKAQKPRR